MKSQIQVIVFWINWSHPVEKTKQIGVKRVQQVPILYECTHINTYVWRIIRHGIEFVTTTSWWNCIRIKAWLNILVNCANNNNYFIILKLNFVAIYWITWYDRLETLFEYLLKIPLQIIDEDFSNFGHYWAHWVQFIIIWFWCFRQAIWNTDYVENQHFSTVVLTWTAILTWSRLLPGIHPALFSDSNSQLTAFISRKYISSLLLFWWKNIFTSFMGTGGREWVLKINILSILIQATLIRTILILLKYVKYITPVLSDS